MSSLSTTTPPGSLEEVQLTLNWDPALIFLSYVQAVQAAYTAIHILQLRVSRWLYIVGALCLSVSGIWSMHFIGMGALKLEANIDFGVGWTVASAIMAFIPCCLALLLVGEKVPYFPANDISIRAHINALKETPHHWVLLSGTLIALGVCAMHYCGMHAMTTEAEHRLNWGVVIVSILIAIFAGTAALYFAFILPITRSFTLPTSLVAGVAVCGMHYTGMYGITYHYPNVSYIPAGEHTNALVGMLKWIVFGSWLLSFCSMALATHLYRSNLVETQRLAENGIRFAGRVSRYVSKYDMNKAQLLCQQVGDAVTEDLKSQFETMLAKLEPYRAYLPQTLFAKSEGDSGEEDLEEVDLWLKDSSDSEEESDDEGYVVAGGDESRMSQTDMFKKNTNKKYKRKKTLVGDDEGSIAMSESGMENSTARSSDAARPSRKGSMASSNHSGSTTHTHSTRMSKRSASSVKAHFTSKLAKDISSKKVTVLSVNMVGFHRILQRHGVASAVNAQASFLRVVHQHITSNKGVISSVHGDHILASFNAASNCAAHVRRAAIAALAIRDDASRNLPHTYGKVVTMGIDSGMAIVGALGTNEIKSFSIVGKLVSRAIIMERLSSLYSEVNVLIPSKVAEELGSDFYHRVVDLLPMSAVSTENNKNDHLLLQDTVKNATNSEGFDPSLGLAAPLPSAKEEPNAPTTNGAAGFLVSALESVKSSGVDDEWMYELQESENKDPFADVNNAFKKLVGVVNGDISRGTTPGTRSPALPSPQDRSLTPQQVSLNTAVSASSSSHRVLVSEVASALNVVQAILTAPVNGDPTGEFSAVIGPGASQLSSDCFANNKTVATVGSSAAVAPTASGQESRKPEEEAARKLSIECLKAVLSRGATKDQYARPLGLLYDLIAK